METHDRENFQGRYVLRHPWRGNASCPAADAYRAALPGRFGLTGWDAKEISTRMQATGQGTK